MMRGQSPTHGWLISNRILRWFAWAMMVLLFFMILFVTAIAYAVNRDCTRPYHSESKVFGYWIHIQVGSTKLECSQS